MAHLTIGIAIPPGNGPGGWTDISALGTERAFNLAGDLDGKVVVEVTDEAAPTIDTVGTVIATLSSPGSVSIASSARWARGVVSGYRSGAGVLTASALIANVAGLRGVNGKVGDIVDLDGYYTPGDGGGGRFWWDPDSNTGDNGGTIFVPTVAPRGRWVRFATGTTPINNVLWFGARTGLSNGAQQTYIQAAIDALGATGGTVFFPEGTYLITASLRIGGAGNYVEGVQLVGESSSMSNLNTQLLWGGAANGGPILVVRNAQVGTLEHLAFNGNGNASYGLQFEHVLGDTGIVTGWKVTQCNFRGAKVANVLIGTVGTDYGDCSCITFDTCYFMRSLAGILTDAHVRQLAQFTFGTTFLNCRFASDVTFYPQKAISIQAGTVIVFGGTMDLQGLASIYMDAANAIPAPSVCIYGVEAQTAAEFLRTAFAGTGFAAPLRASVISGVSISDISGNVANPVIYWDADRYGSLFLQGVHLQQPVNIQIADATAKVFVQDVLFPPAGGAFTGVGAGQVCGTWWQQTRYYMRIPNVPEFANNAAALAGGLIAGDFYRVTGGGDLQVVV